MTIKMKRRTTSVVERLRRFTNLGPCDSDGKVSLSKEVATILEDLCGEAADMITALREQIDKETVITVDPKYPPFGSFGDSITIDEIQKKYEEYKQQTFSNLQSETMNPTYGDNCWARLPCGICRMTNMQCPMQVQKYEVTCSSQTGAPTGTVK